MYVLFTDETNLQAKDAVRFFSYGGLIVPMENVPQLHEKIAAIRKKYKYNPKDKLKFDTNARPKHVTVEEAANAKREVIQACIECECLFIAYVVLHAIAAKKAPSEIIMWGANTVIGKFNYFLECEDKHGIVAMDRLPDGVEFDYLSEKFTDGLAIGDEGATPLDRIALFSSTCINASHLSSAMDIVLGAWRYCINSPKNKAAAKEMITDIARLIWCERHGEELDVLELGLIFRPKDIKFEPYRQEYDHLLDQINDLLADE